MSVEGAPPATQNHPDRDGSRKKWRLQRSVGSAGHPLGTPQPGGWHGVVSVGQPMTAGSGEWPLEATGVGATASAVSTGLFPATQA